jgi:hypothetical protein
VQGEFNMETMMETHEAVGNYQSDPSGAKAHGDLAVSAARINPCPFKAEDPSAGGIKTAVEDFMREYARHSDEGDVAALAMCFAETFVAGGSQGAKAVRASDFALALPKRITLFAQMGCRRTELVRMETQQMDARYVWARTRWRLTFERAGGDALPVEVESSYLVDAGAEPMRFLVYLAHDDIMGMLRERGIATA